MFSTTVNRSEYETQMRSANLSKEALQDELNRIAQKGLQAKAQGLKRRLHVLRMHYTVVRQLLQES